MRIAQIHWGFPPIIGGVETHLVFLLPELVKMGHKVSLLTCSADGYPERSDFYGAKVFRSQFYDLNWLFKSNFQEVDDNVYEITFKHLDEVKPDIIHAHNMHYFSRYHTRVLEHYAQENNIPLVLTAHNAWKDKLYLDLTCKVAWDKIVAISHYIKRELMAVGVPEEKIAVIHHGIDHKKFHPGPVNRKRLKDHPGLKPKKGRTVFHPARMGLAKGCDIAIQAFRLVKNRFPDARLIMSGSGNIIDWGLTQNKDIAYLVTLIKHLKLEDSIYINTFSLDKEMPELYRMADVVIYPSNSEEPFGLTMLEAMASAKPIVVTQSGGMPEIIKDDINGYVVPKNNHEALAEKIIKLLEDSDLRKHLGKNGRELVDRKYNKEIYTKNLAALYKEVIAEFPKKKHKRKKKSRFAMARDDLRG